MGEQVVAQSLNEVYAGIEVANLRLRDKFVSTMPLLTADDFASWVADGSLRPGELEEWVANRLIFSVVHNGQQVFPAFQFLATRPRPVLARVLKQLVEETDWQIAFWFVSSNPALDGVAPVDKLDDEEAVIAATQGDGYTG